MPSPLGEIPTPANVSSEMTQASLRRKKSRNGTLQMYFKQSETQRGACFEDRSQEDGREREEEDSQTQRKRKNNEVLHRKLYQIKMAISC